MKTKDKVLTEEQVGFYSENGYLVVDAVLAPDGSDRLLSTFEKYADKDYSAILNLDRKVPEVRDMMKNLRIVGIMETLQNAEVVGLMSQVLFKKAGSLYASQAWNPHQDNAYPQAKCGAYITVNIFLMDADPGNGGMYIFPGSHKEPLLPFEATKSYREKPGTNPGNTCAVPDKYNKVDLRIKKGGMLVLHGNVIHGSYPNKSVDRSRPLYSISYITKGEDFISGKNANRMVIDLK
jgi:ectoine hydroxylase-related dioxygenase (phytanoyl-CoA dioxygenase family)